MMIYTEGKLKITRKCGNFDALQLEAARRRASHFFNYDAYIRLKSVDLSVHDITILLLIRYVTL